MAFTEPFQIVGFVSCATSAHFFLDIQKKRSYLYSVAVFSLPSRQRGVPLPFRREIWGIVREHNPLFYSPPLSNVFYINVRAVTLVYLVKTPVF